MQRCKIQLGVAPGEPLFDQPGDADRIEHALVRGFGDIVAPTHPGAVAGLFGKLHGRLEKVDVVATARRTTR